MIGKLFEWLVEYLNMVFEKVKEIIVNYLGIDENKISEKTNFENDLEADSLDFFQIINELEEEFNVTIDTDQRIETVGELVKHINKELA